MRTTNRIKITLTALSALLCLSSLQGCTTTKSKAMLPSNVAIVSTHAHSVAVHAQGTARRLGIGPPFVPAEVLQEAVEDSILNCELFEAITTDEYATYALRLKVTKFTKPESGLDMTTAIAILWSLRDAQTRTVLWSETITTTFTASSNQNGMLDERLQTSIEGAVRKNIQLGLEKVSALSL